MTLKPCLHGINKRISNKLFMLRTICKYLNYDNSILVYKQTIMTIFDYSGFMFFSLGKMMYCGFDTKIGKIM